GPAGARRWTLRKSGGEINEPTGPYPRHMLAAAHGGSTAEALAALLPCPCVYAYVGQQLVQGPPPPNPMYAEWIEFYAPGRVDPRIAIVQALYDRVAATADA